MNLEVKDSNHKSLRRYTHTFMTLNYAHYNFKEEKKT